MSYCSLPILFLKAQADWYNNHGPVPNVPDVDPPSGGNGDGGDDDTLPPGPSEEGFVIASCAFTGDPTSGCLDESVGEASMELVTMFAKAYLNSSLSDTVRLIIPAVYSQYEAIQLLYFVETRAINTTQTKLVNDFGRLRALEWSTEAEKARALIIIQNDENTINKWNREAREEANNHINWSHEWDYDGKENSKHDFHLGPAYEQLKTISSLGWLNR